MNRIYVFFLMFFFTSGLHSQVIISQVYEGASNNKWIELTNVGSSTIDLSTLKLGIWTSSGDSGNGNITGNPSTSITLSGTLAPGEIYLMRNNDASETVPHNPMPTANNSNTSVAGFNGNDALALLDVNNVVIDAFGHGINNKDISYHRNFNIVNTNASFTVSEWTTKTLAEVLASNNTLSEYISTHLYDLPTSPIILLNPNSISGLDYEVGNGPSASEVFEISGSNLDLSDVVLTAPTNFEISSDDVNFGASITLPFFDGTATNLYVRLQSGLAEDTYVGDIAITGGGDSDGASISLSGNVFVPFSLPYTNALNTQILVDEATGLGFEMTNVSFQSAGGGYLRFDNVGASIISPTIDFTQMGSLLVQFTPATFGTISSTNISVYLSNDNGTSYTLIEEYNPSSSTYTSENLFLDLTGFNTNQGRIKFERTSGATQIRFRALAITGYTDNAQVPSNVTYQNVTLGDGAFVELGDNVTLTVSNKLTRAGSNGFFILGTGALLAQTVADLDILFPIGTDIAYLPATINGGSPTSNQFSVGVTNSLDACFAADPAQSVDVTWNIESGHPSPADVTLSFDFSNVTPGTGFDEVTAKIAHCGVDVETFGSVTGNVATGSGFSSFSPFAVTSDPVVLPVTWLSVNAKPVGKTVSVEWSTAIETSNAYFVIERSTNGFRFETLGQVNGALFSATTNKYHFTDVRPETGLNYYRIKQVDMNGAYSYSMVVSVPLSGQTMGLYRTQSNTIQFTGDINNAQLKVYTLRGDIVIQKVVDQASVIDMSGLHPGMYVAVLSQDGQVVTEKVMVQ